MTPEQWRQTGQTEDCLGHRIFVREGGNPDGPALLLIHGFPSASWDWHRVWDGLAPRYRLIAPDLLGYGFSAKPLPFDYRIGLQADLLVELLAVRGISTVSLLAHDYGDTVAQELLARQLEGALGNLQIEKAVLLNGGLFPETHRALLTQKLLASPLGPVLARHTPRFLFRRSVTRTLGHAHRNDRDFPDGLWQLLNENHGREVMALLIDYMRQRRLNRERWLGALQGNVSQLALVVGADDPVSGTHMVERYRELVSAERITLLPGIGHFPQYEAPDAVVRAVLDHLHQSPHPRAV